MSIHDKIKLICCDVDGTLVGEGQGTLHPEYYDVFKYLKQKGIYLAACSGRQVISLETLFAPVGQDMWYVAENGAYLGTYGKVLHANLLNQEVYLDLVKNIEQIPEATDFMVSTTRLTYMQPTNPWLINQVQNGYGYRVEVLENLYSLPQPGIKIAIYVESGEVNKVRDLLRQQWENQFLIVSSGALWVDIMSYNVNKGNAVAKIQEYLQISKSQTMVFGDQQNDVEMLMQAKYSYAVEGAIPAAVEAANFRCKGPQDLGVLEILKQL